MTWLEAAMLRRVYLAHQASGTYDIPAVADVVRRHAREASVNLDDLGVKILRFDQTGPIEGYLVQTLCLELLCEGYLTQHWRRAISPQDTIPLTTVVAMLLWLNGPQRERNLVELAEGWEERIDGDYPIDSDAILETLDTLADRGWVTVAADLCWHLVPENVDDLWRPTAYERMLES